MEINSIIPLIYNSTLFPYYLKYIHKIIIKIHKRFKIYKDGIHDTNIRKNPRIQRVLCMD